jgi:Tfp pilus assembly protein PilF
MEAHEPDQLLTRDRLLRNIEWAMANDFSDDDLLPMLAKLASLSQAGSPEWEFAHRHSAEILIERNPWQATIFARLARQSCPNDDRLYALEALALTVLGHYHLAEKAYRKALEFSPGNPFYSHNLGHLLDVRLHRPTEAIRLLRYAHENVAHDEIACSLALALGRNGQVDQAKLILTKALGKAEPTQEQAELLHWLDQQQLTKPKTDARPTRNALRRVKM